MQYTEIFLLSPDQNLSTTVSVLMNISFLFRKADMLNRLSYHGTALELATTREAEGAVTHAMFAANIAQCLHVAGFTLLRFWLKGLIM